MAPIKTLVAISLNRAGIALIVGCILVSSGLAQHRTRRTENPTPAFQLQSPASIQSPPAMLPQRNIGGLRFVEHDDPQEPLVDLDGANNAFSSEPPSRVSPKPRDHVNFKNLQVLSRDIDQTLRTDEEVFGTLMSEVDQLAEVIRQQKAHKERVVKEKQAAEAKALAIQEELRNAKKAAEEARRQAESLLRRQQELAGPLDPQMTPSAAANDHFAADGTQDPGSKTPHPANDKTLDPSSDPTLSNSNSSPDESIELIPRRGSPERFQSGNDHAPTDVTDQVPHESDGTHSEQADETGGSLGEPKELNDPTLTPSDLAVEPPPKAVTHEAVDRQSLADSLFGTGEYKLALATYRQLIREEKGNGEKSAWLRFQTANCYRHLGEVKQAEAYYREVAADRRDVFLSGMSRWWLEHLDERKQLSSRIEKWKLVATQIEKASK